MTRLHIGGDKDEYEGLNVTFDLSIITSHWPRSVPLGNQSLCGSVL